MDWLIMAKKGVKCSECGGAGYLPLNDKKTSKSRDYTVEIICSKCKGKKFNWKEVELSLESLKEMLK